MEKKKQAKCSSLLPARIYGLYSISFGYTIISDIFQK